MCVIITLYSVKIFYGNEKKNDVKSLVMMYYGVVCIWRVLWTVVIRRK